MGPTIRLLFLSLLLCAVAHGDVLRLGQGRVIRGKVVKETADTLFVDVGYTVIPVPKKEILSREADPAEKAKADEKPEKATDATASSAEALYSTVEREEMSVKDNVTRTQGAVVMVTTPGGLGSGFIITPDGYLVTNDHVIQKETKITVVLFEKDKKGGLAKRKVEDVKIVALNPYVDLALLKMEGVKDLPIAYFGDIADLRAGQAVYAIGNPLGLERSVSEGIVSTKNRPFEGLPYVQTTTAINPGNSGGPLFNLAGEVVGVTNMQIVFSEGLNFAIPVDAVKRFLKNREAFAFDKDNPNTGYRYLAPPPKPKKGGSQ
ncbi:MAG: S1C family serine protease [Planctomycetota bacterium]